MNHRVPLLAALLLSPLVEAEAQCADGSPPPCRTQTTVSAVRRADPPLDGKTWIVVPFDNLNNNQDIDWLRTGSVNLLYLGMSRWTDIRVIDDERVADYMRDVPGADAARSLSLNMAMAVAKRAGAGQVVMGDVLKLGNRTTINAKVFDVKTGQRVRSVREETNFPDSIMSVFGRLAQKVLAVPAPPGVNSGAQVTNSIAAYQEYARGMAALNRFDLSVGEAHLKRALQLDSAFALAHAKLSVLLGWVAPGSLAGRQHAEAAGRLSASLPPREQALVKASVAFAKQDFVAACDGFRALVVKDSTDTDAWYGLGDCLYHDQALLPTDGDSLKPVWRASRNESLRAFQRVLALDPTYHLAYQHIVEMYNLQIIGNNAWCTGGRCTQLIAVVRPSGDSLLFAPLMLPRDTALYRQHLEENVRTNGRRRMLATGRAIAEGWVAANPAEGRARFMYATTLAALGQIVAADSILRRAVLLDTGLAAVNARMLRMELALKRWDAAASHILFDSLRSQWSVIVRTPAGAITTGGVATLLGPVFGRPALFDSLIEASLRQARVPQNRLRLSMRSVRVMMGATSSDSLAAAIAEVYAEIRGPAGTAVATRSLAPALAFSLREASATWPQFDTTVTDVRAAPLLAVQRNDTAALRRAARTLDSLSTVYMASLAPDTGAALIAAEAYLVLRDSTKALQMTRRWLDSVYTYTTLIVGQSGGTAVHQQITRIAVLRADLAAALGARDEARLWYDRLLALMTHPDPDVAPLVERVRRSRAALGSAGGRDD
jgi:TolB-like protein